MTLFTHTTRGWAMQLPQVAYKQNSMTMGAPDLEGLGQGLYLCSGHSSNLSQGWDDH